MNMTENEYWNMENQRELRKLISEQKKTNKMLSETSIRGIRTLMEYAYYLKMTHTKDSRSAKHEFEAIIKIDPVNAEACYRLGYLYYQESNWLKAIEYFEKAITNNKIDLNFPLEDFQIVKAPLFKGFCAMQLVKEAQSYIDNLSDDELEIEGSGILAYDLAEKFAEELEFRKYTITTNKAGRGFLSESDYEEIIDSREFEIIVNYADLDLHIIYKNKTIYLKKIYMDLLVELLIKEGHRVTPEHFEIIPKWETLRKRVERLNLSLCESSLINDKKCLKPTILNHFGEHAYYLPKMNFAIIDLA